MFFPEQGNQDQFLNPVEMKNDICDLLRFIINHLHRVLILKVDILFKKNVFHSSDTIQKELKIAITKRKGKYEMKLSQNQKFGTLLKEITKYMSMAKNALIEICGLIPHLEEYTTSFRTQLD